MPQFPACNIYLIFLDRSVPTTMARASATKSRTSHERNSVKRYCPASVMAANDSPAVNIIRERRFLFLILPVQPVRRKGKGRNMAKWMYLSTPIPIKRDGSFIPVSEKSYRHRNKTAATYIMVTAIDSLVSLFIKSGHAWRVILRP